MIRAAQMPQGQQAQDHADQLEWEETQEKAISIWSNPLEETEIPVELGAPITKLEEEARTHDPDTDLVQLQLKTQ